MLKSTKEINFHLVSEGNYLYLVYTICYNSIYSIYYIAINHFEIS